MTNSFKFADILGYSVRVVRVWKDGEVLHTLSLKDDGILINPPIITDDEETALLRFLGDEKEYRHV